MGNVVLGGVLAVLAGIVGHFVAHLLQSKRDQRARQVEQRSAAHLAFARAVKELREAVEDSDYTREPPSAYDHRVFGELPILLMTIEMFALPATFRAAETVMDRLKEWVRTDGKADSAPVSAAFDAYMGQVRKELGLNDPARRNWRSAR
ncbi:hypothetical protein [Streptosporangium vulgare]|uniref:Uncharacterized protein n=1 Tax=Streptosporangium vulgare TaxID=46190 RepID=A0ABV5TQ42_9ACTN